MTKKRKIFIWISGIIIGYTILSICVFFYNYYSTQKKVKKGISDWILKYALYPESYEPILYSEFEQSFNSNNGITVGNSEKYVIKHVHKMRNVDSTLRTYDAYFILLNDFSVNIIEVERSNKIGGAFPPQTKIWTDLFGRSLNLIDSLEFNQLQKEFKKKLIKDLKDGFKKEEFSLEDSNGVEKLKTVLKNMKNSL